MRLSVQPAAMTGVRTLPPDIIIRTIRPIPEIEGTSADIRRLPHQPAINCGSVPDRHSMTTSVHP
jgi:hypothetical protein